MNEFVNYPLKGKNMLYGSRKETRKKVSLLFHLFIINGMNHKKNIILEI